ncbi:MAG: DUF350 domain-containing protein [Erythrobacter sp.]
MAPNAVMSTGSAPNIVDTAEDGAVSDNFAENWRDLRDNGDIQFAPVEVPEPPPREPSWFEDFMRSVGELLEPVFRGFPNIWPFFKWGLIIIGVLLVAYVIYRLVEPYLVTPRRDRAEIEEPEWQPDAAQSLALLEDADRLAAQGKFDEATHLLLQRSVTHLSEAKPDWVEPSSTARELTAIEALPDKARETFAVIAERVERSLFAMRALGKDDWEAARAAYADFASTSLRGPIG